MRALTTTPFDDDKLREECGVFGVFGHPDAAALTVLGLHALQHRGQEGAGIVSFDGSQFHSARHFGLVGDNFTQPAVVDRLTGVDFVAVNAWPTALCSRSGATTYTSPSGTSASASAESPAA